MEILGFYIFNHILIELLCLKESFYKLRSIVINSKK